jgi:hypothetical protein
MDFSKKTVQSIQPQLDGEKLIQTVVSLTGLPADLAPLVNQHMGEILDHSGQTSSDCTLDDLRAAMLAYLESVHADLGHAEMVELSDADLSPPDSSL